MHTRIMTTGMNLSRANRRFIHERLRATLGRHADELQHVDVFLKDLNGPKGGRDTSARLRVRLSNGRVVTVEDVRDALEAAMTRASQRMGFAIRRAMEENRQIDRGSRRAARRKIDHEPLPALSLA